MGDVGDYWREERQHRQALRRHWHECPTCAAHYGTGTSVPPGGACRNCGWRAPGRRGDDQRAVDALWKDEEQIAAEKEAKRRRKLEAQTCRFCGKVMKDSHGRRNHEEAKHAEALAEAKAARRRATKDGEGEDADPS